MRPEASPEALAEQMLLLTLAAEQALTREDWSEANALMDRRETILNRLEGLELTPEAEEHLDQVQRIESMLLARMQAHRSEVIGQMIVDRRQAQAASQYRRQA